MAKPKLVCKNIFKTEDIEERKREFNERWRTLLEQDCEEPSAGEECAAQSGAGGL